MKNYVFHIFNQLGYPVEWKSLDSQSRACCQRQHPFLIPKLRVPSFTAPASTLCSVNLECKLQRPPCYA